MTKYFTANLLNKCGVFGPLGWVTSERLKVVGQPHVFWFLLIVVFTFFNVLLAGSEIWAL
jgi:hypothetical protein